jgi:single-strand DNA-binding protein
MNKVLLIGNVGKDAEVRQTQHGVPYAHFTLATSTGGYKKKDGTEVPKQTEWHNITVWRSLATMAGKYCKKGVCVVVNGALHYGEYNDQQGVKRTTVEIVATDISIPNGRAVFGGTQAQQAPQANTPPQQNYGGYGAENGYQQNNPPQAMPPQNAAPQQGGWGGQQQGGSSAVDEYPF